MKYSEAQSRQWLGWIARELQRRNATVFLIEELQPACLASTGQFLFYVLLSRVPLVVAFTAIGIWTFESARVQYDWLRVAGGWSIALVALAAMDAARWWAPPTRLRTVGRWVAVYATALLGTILLSFDGGVPDSALIYPLYGWVLAGGGARDRTCEIRPVETFTWSWRQGLWRASFGGVLAAAAFWMCRYDHLNSGFAELGVILMVFGALHGLNAGLPRLTVVPNQAIRTTLKLAMYVAAGVLTTIVTTLVVAARVVPGYDWVDRGGIASVFHVSVLVATWGFLHFGGRDVVRHAALRLVLWTTGAVPLRMARFLDYAARDLEILQKVGGGYIFIHRMMLEHFARHTASGFSATRSQPAASQSASAL
jgi:hypothetical protein